MIKITCSCGAKMETDEEFPLIAITTFQKQHKQCIDNQAFEEPAHTELQNYLNEVQQGLQLA